MAATAECSVCYVTDLHFLLASILSALQLRKYVTASIADIFIFSVDVDTAIVDETNIRLKENNVHIIPIPNTYFADLDRGRLERTHTTLATFGRFFMDAALPTSCKRLVYLDGDVWATRDPIQLIEATVPIGRFAAADDAIFFRQRVGVGRTARQIREYFSGLRLNANNGYFNAGVFAAARTTWKGLADEAYRYFMSNQEVCKRFDQSALNAVVGDRRLRLSAKWNFQTQFKIWNAERIVEPNLCHFNLHPKPWDGNILPWQNMSPVYAAAAEHFGVDSLPLGNCTPEQVVEHNHRFQRNYSYLQMPFVSGIALSAMGFAEIERKAWI